MICDSADPRAETTKMTPANIIRDRVAVTRSPLLGISHNRDRRLVKQSVRRCTRRSRSLWYSSTIRPEAKLHYPYHRIKSGGDFSRPATELEKRPRCSPSKEGIRPVGAQTTLVLPKLSKASSPLGGMMSSHDDSFAASGSSPTDFRCEHHGSVFLLFPRTESAHSWIEENLPTDAQWFGNALVIEHRYVWAILEGIQNDGLAVQA